MQPLFQLTAEQKEGVAAVTKATVAWTSVGIASSADLANWAQAIASFAAALYTVFLILEFLWKKVVRPICEWQGWIKKKGKKRADE